MSKLGAFVAGLGTGYVTGSKLRLANQGAAMARERNKRERERWQREKEQRDREQAVWQQLADLAEKYGGFATPPRVEQKGVSGFSRPSMPPATPMMPPAAVPSEGTDEWLDDDGGEE